MRLRRIAGDSFLKPKSPARLHRIPFLVTAIRRYTGCNTEKSPLDFFSLRLHSSAVNETSESLRLFPNLLCQLFNLIDAIHDFEG